MSFFRFSKITLRAHKFFIFFNRLKLFKTFSNQSTYLEKIHSDKIFGFHFSSSILKAHSLPNQNVINDSRILVIKNDSRILVNIDIRKRETCKSIHESEACKSMHKSETCTKVEYEA